jgi:hypothetical protein
MRSKQAQFLLIIFAMAWFSVQAVAHHVLGRPSYSLSEDSNTPPSMQVETQVGKYFVTYMAFPAFPKPNEPGRVNVYASRISDGQPFVGEITFKVRDDSWFSSNQEIIGKQPIDDNVYRQSFIFKNAGDYIITAEFIADGEPYIIDFPLTIGKPLPIGLVGGAALVIFLVLITVNIVQRRRLQRLGTERARDEHERMA